MQVIIYDEQEQQFTIVSAGCDGIQRRKVKSDDIAERCPDVSILALDAALRNPGMVISSNMEGLCR